MSLIRLVAAGSLALGALCPIATHALAHEVNSKHLRAHEDGVAHDHDAEGHPHDHELRHVDDVPRIGGSSTRFVPESAVVWAVIPGEPLVLSPSPAPVSLSCLDPPRLLHPGCLVPSCAGRAPPA